MSGRNIVTSTAALLMIIGLIVGSTGSYFLSTLPLKESMNEKDFQQKELQALSLVQTEEIENLSSLVLELELQISETQELIHEYQSNVSTLEKEIQELNAHIFELEMQVHNQTSLWDMEPKISLDYWPSGSWIYRDYQGGGSLNYSYHESTDALNDVFYSNASKIITDNYCNMFVNSYNNTIWVVLKSLEPEVLDAFMDVMDPLPGVMVKFLKGPASWWEVEEWLWVIIPELDNLLAEGVGIISISRTENATILIGIEDITLEKVQIVLGVLKGRVPPGILVFTKEAMPVLD